MEISVVIPTYKRNEDLKECLDSILKQSKNSVEVLVVDNALDEETEILISKMERNFKEKNISLKYFRNEKGNSLTAARNLAVEKSRGDIILFLDDDVVLDSDYMKEILKVYNNYPNAFGVQGLIRDNSFKKTRLYGNIVNLFCRFFLLGYSGKNKCKVLPSVSSVFPYWYLLDRIISCETLSGANHSFSKNIFKEFKYDEKLKKYSEGEDLDISYRVFKKYPDSLYMTPYACLTHKNSFAGRMPIKEIIYMKEVYCLYLFYKIIPQNLKNKMIYFWSRIGKVVLNIGFSLVKSFKIGSIRNIYLIESYIFCLRNIKNIKKGDLDFFNKILL